MLRFSADLQIHRPVDQVVARLTDPLHQGKFDKRSLKLEALRPGPWRTGTHFGELRDLGVRKTEVPSEVAELEPNRYFVIRSKTGPEWLGTWRFEPDGSGTRLRWTGELRMIGFGRLLEPVIGRQMRSQIDRQFANLPRLMEAEILEGVQGKW